MTNIDIMYLRNARPEFTAASEQSIEENTNGQIVHVKWNFEGESSPVAAMNKFLDAQLISHGAPEIFAKIDNDVIVPPGWVEAAVSVMDAHPELDILGLEPWQSRTPAPWAKGKLVDTPDKNWIGAPGYVKVDCVGGVFLARRRAFARSRPIATGTYGGWTNFQTEHPELVKGWITPSLKLFLLDRLTFEPWASLSRRYEAEGVQRPWSKYGPEAAVLYNWWTARRAQEIK